MADDTSTTQDAAEASVTEAMDDGQQAEDTTTDDNGLPEGAKKALQAARRQAREAEKARRELAAKVQQYEQRDMTEQQKLEQRATAAENAAADASRELNRIRAATAAGLGIDDADLVTGTTPAEMKASAERLAERFGGAGTTFDGGVRTSAGRVTDMNDLIRRSVGGGR